MKRNELPHLIEEIQKGNDEAFAHLYHEFHTAFFYMAYKLTNNEADAHDAVQDTFIRIRDHIGELKNPNVAIVWMKKILFNRCKNMFRDNREIYVKDSVLSAMDVADEREDALPYESMRRKSDREVVLRLLAKIPYLYREPLILKYYDDAKMSEIAKVLGIPEGTVKSRLRTGKRLLKEQIAIYEADTMERVPYHVFPLGWILYFGFQKEAATFLASNISYKGYLPKPIYSLMTCVAVGASVAVVGGVCTQLLQDDTQIVQSMEASSNDITDQEAYFHVRGIAHCDEDLRSLSEEDLYRLRPYVEQLKANKGAFYELLKQDNWLKTYEELVK